MRYGDDHVEDDDTDKYDGFETLCRGASDRLGLGWTNRQPNTWAWRAQCRTRFSICCSRTGGARLLSSSTRFLCASVERPHILDQPQQRELTNLFCCKGKLFGSWQKLLSILPTYFFARDFLTASVSFSSVFLWNRNFLTMNLGTLSHWWLGLWSLNSGKFFFQVLFLDGKGYEMIPLCFLNLGSRLCEKRLVHFYDGESGNAASDHPFPSTKAKTFWNKRI